MVTNQLFLVTGPRYVTGFAGPSLRNASDSKGDRTTGRTIGHRQVGEGAEKGDQDGGGSGGV